MNASSRRALSVGDLPTVSLTSAPSAGRLDVREHVAFKDPQDAPIFECVELAGIDTAPYRRDGLAEDLSDLRQAKRLPESLRVCLEVDP